MPRGPLGGGTFELSVLELLTAAPPGRMPGESVTFPQCGPTRGAVQGSVQLHGRGIMPLLNTGAAFVLKPNEHSS